MSAKYWIKLYHETLHDRKIAQLDDRLWRRWIECLLLAGEENKGGFLPPLQDIAWTLRIDEEQLETDLIELVRIKVLETRDGLYYVRKFAERQEPMSKAEYMRRKRNEEQLQEHYQSSYQSVTSSNAESESESDKNQNAPDFPLILSAIQASSIFSDITGMVAIPNSKDRDQAHTMENLYDLRRKYKTRSEMILDGKTYFDAWRGRKYSQTNTAWIDWWIAGEIPTKKLEQKSPHNIPTETYG